MADDVNKERRDLVSQASVWSMRAGLAAGYGLFAFIAARFLYPAKPPHREWMYVSEVDELAVGDGLVFRGPNRETVNVTRQGADTFLALSSTCPHLGCNVNWEPQNNRFFCPCHNGEFDVEGKGYAGPPGDAGQSLPRYPLKVENGLLFIEMQTESLASNETPRGEVIAKVPGIHGPGHDPCLTGRKLCRREDGSLA